MAKNDKNVITLGSGKLFAVTFTSTSAIPDLDTMCVEANRLGWIKGGASVEYTPSSQEVKDDLGMVSKIIVTQEEAILKTGIMTWNGETLAKLCDTGRVTTDTTNHIRTCKIGGIDNADNTDYVIVFEYDDVADGKKWIRIVGRNSGGFSFSFKADEATVIDAEFHCAPKLDAAGTLIELIEELDS